jgi:hypothetical protein
MNLRIGLILISVIWISAISTSCHKTDPTKAIVSVRDTANMPVAGVKVTVYANPNGSYIDPQNLTLNDVQYTDGGGQVSFTFKNKAILNAKAETFFINSNNVDREGKGLLILEEGKTIEKTIQIK